MKKLVLSAALLLAILPNTSFAAAKSSSSGGSEVINQLRFFYGQNSIDPKEANEAAEAAGFGQFKKMDHYAIEASRDVAPYLNLGLRLGIKSARVTPTDKTVTGNYYSSLMNSGLMGLVTVPFVKTEKFKLEAFTGLGMSSTSYSIKTATQDGKLSQGQTPNFIAGASFAVGYKYVFLKFEGGYEYCAPDGLTQTGTMTKNIEKLDMSGSYFNIGIMIDGLALGRL